LYNLNVKVKNFENTCYIRIYSKELVEFKSKVIGLPIGPKTSLKKLPTLIISRGPDCVSSLIAVYLMQMVVSKSSIKIKGYILP